MIDRYHSEVLCLKCICKYAYNQTDNCINKCTSLKVPMQKKKTSADSFIKLIYLLHLQSQPWAQKHRNCLRHHHARSDDVLRKLQILAWGRKEGNAAGFRVCGSRRKIAGILHYFLLSIQTSSRAYLSERGPS